MQMTMGRDDALYVTEAAGSVMRVDLTDKSKRQVATGLAVPKGIAQTPWGSFVVMEVAARHLTELDPATGGRRTVAANLPVSMPDDPKMPPVSAATGMAVDAEGNVYFSADQNAGTRCARSADDCESGHARSFQRTHRKSVGPPEDRQICTAGGSAHDGRPSTKLWTLISASRVSAGSWHRDPGCPAAQEIEIDALVGLGHGVQEELQVAAGRGRPGDRLERRPPGQFFGGYQ
jgi:streptogramin lyase